MKLNQLTQQLFYGRTALTRPGRNAVYLARTKPPG